MVSCGPNCVDVYINGMNNKCLLWINRWNIGPQVVCCCFSCCCLSFIGRYLMFCNICILTCQSKFCTVNENYSYKSPKLYLLCISFLNCHLNIQTAQNSFAKSFWKLTHTRTSSSKARHNSHMKILWICEEACFFYI